MSDEFPNGMRPRQHVRVYSVHGRKGRLILGEGEVVAYYDRPTIVVRSPEGRYTHLAADLDWDDLDDVPVTGPQRVRAALGVVRGAEGGEGR